jgi:hypothetical protein
MSLHSKSHTVPDFALTFSCCWTAAKTLVYAAVCYRFSFGTSPTMLSIFG